jgi:hypothetical protein
MGITSTINLNFQSIYKAKTTVYKLEYNCSPYCIIIKLWLARSDRLVPPKIEIMKKIALFIFFLSTVSFLFAQQTETTESTPDDISEAIDERLEIFGYNPVNGELLPGSTPYPFVGKPSDSDPDKIQWAVVISLPSDITGIEEYMENAQVGILIKPTSSQDEEPDPNDADDWGAYEPWRNFIFGTTRPGRITKYLSGEIDLSFDVSQLQQLNFMAALIVNGGIIDTFNTEIIAGNPELTIHSKITSGGQIMSGALFYSEVSGRIPLAFEPDYSILKGRGPLTYEKFEIDPDDERCTISTKTSPDDWRVEVVFPAGLTLLESSIDSFRYLPPPLESVTMIGPKIKESATFRCPGGVPPILKYPKLIHFFASFMSFHGGEIPCYDLVTRELVEQTNEMNRSRGGLIMTNWKPGTGNIIATRTYRRLGARGGATFEEDTKLVLRWPGE